MNEVRDLLMRTKRLFTSGHWTQGTMWNSTMRDGQLVDLFCLVGGLRKNSDFYTPNNDGVYERTMELLAETIMGDKVTPVSVKNILINFNDSRNNADEVVEMIDKAVARLDS